MRLVVDTNILISALLSATSSPARIILLWRAGRFDLLTAAEQLDELARVTRYPKIRVGGGSVAGQQAEERYSHLKQDCLTLQVDRDVYQRAIAAARPTLTVLGIPDQVAASVERYSLSGNDCMDFILRVAQPLKPAGLSIPKRGSTDTPLDYIRKMTAANP